MGRYIEIRRKVLIALVLCLQPASLVERRIPPAVPAQSTQPRQGARLQKWAKSGRKWAKKIAENGRKWPKMAENSQKWAKIGRKWPKMAENGPKMDRK